MDPVAAFEKIVRSYGIDPEVSLRHSMNNSALTVDGRIFAFEKHGRLVVKLPADRCAALLSLERAETYQLGRRVMRQWVAVPSARVHEWAELADEARLFVRSVRTTR